MKAPYIVIQNFHSILNSLIQNIELIFRCILILNGICLEVIGRMHCAYAIRWESLYAIYATTTNGCPVTVTVNKIVQGFWFSCKITFVPSIPARLLSVCIYIFCSNFRLKYHDSLRFYVASV